MYDLLPFPQITATEPKEQVRQLTDYLFKFKEELEFILTGISVENLSQDLVDKLNSLGANIEKSNEDNAEQLQQIRSVTVSDVINSEAFDVAVKSRMPSFSINFETGELEYR